MQALKSVADFVPRTARKNFNHKSPRQKVNCRKAAREAALERARQKHFSLRACRSRLSGGKAQSGTHLSQKRGTQLKAASLFLNIFYTPAKWNTTPITAETPIKTIGCRFLVFLM